MKENFDRAFELTVGLEGGYTNDPKDPGGETKYGISKRWNPDVDIKNLTVDQAKAIYLKRYWTPCGCDSLPYPVDCLTFDRSVLYGPADAIAWAKTANTWDDILFKSLQHIYDHWNPTYSRGWVGRILRLWKLFDKGGPACS